MLNLPAPDHTPLTSPSLPLVVAQARFTTTVGDVGRDAVALVQDRLGQAGVDLPKVDAVANGDVVVTGPGGASVRTSSTSGFQLSRPDGAWLVTLTNSWVSIETPAFESFATQFGPLLLDVLQATHAAVQPVTITRAGLRFVNVLQKPDGAGESWAEWVRPALVAAQEDPLLGPGVLAQSQQLLFEVTPEVRSVVRCGPSQLNDGPESFLLDIDTFAEPSRLWVEQEVVDLFGELNGFGVALFQGLVTPAMLSHLKRTPSSDGGSQSG